MKRTIVIVVIFLTMSTNNCAQTSEESCKGLLNFYNAMMEKYPSKINADSYIDRGGCYLCLKEYSKALSDFDKSIELESYHARAYYCRGLVYYELNEYTNALSEFSKAIEINPNYGEAYFNRGTIYYNSGNTTNACEDWVKAYKLGLGESKELLNQYCK